jgi:transposase
MFKDQQCEEHRWCQPSMTLFGPIAVLVLDNAKPHTCREVAKHIEHWGQRGLVLYNLPPYSPELNAIEHLWRKLKHQLIPPTAWETIEKLAQSLMRSLKQLGPVRQLEPIAAL